MEVSPTEGYTSPFSELLLCLLFLRHNKLKITFMPRRHTVGQHILSSFDAMLSACQPSEVPSYTSGEILSDTRRKWNFWTMSFCFSVCLVIFWASHKFLESSHIFIFLVQMTICWKGRFRKKKKNTKKSIALVCALISVAFIWANLTTDQSGKRASSGL